MLFRSEKIKITGAMVSAYRVDALRDPTSELRNLFTEHTSSQDFATEVTRHFSNIFSSDEAFMEVRKTSCQCKCAITLCYRYQTLMCVTLQKPTATGRWCVSAQWCKTRPPHPKCICAKVPKEHCVDGEYMKNLKTNVTKPSTIHS